MTPHDSGHGLDGRNDDAVPVTVLLMKSCRYCFPHADIPLFCQPVISYWSYFAPPNPFLEKLLRRVISSVVFMIIGFFSMIFRGIFNRTLKNVTILFHLLLTKVLHKDGRGMKHFASIHHGYKFQFIDWYFLQLLLKCVICGKMHKLSNPRTRSQANFS